MQEGRADKRGLSETSGGLCGLGRGDSHSRQKQRATRRPPLAPLGCKAGQKVILLLIVGCAYLCGGSECAIGCCRGGNVLTIRPKEEEARLATGFWKLG